MKEKQIKEDLSGKGLSDKNPALQRLIKFLDSKGKHSVIARRINKSENVFSNMIQRDTKPSLDVLLALSDEFPDLDIHYISTGKFSKQHEELQEKFKVMESEFTKELAYQKMIITKFAEPGKTKAALKSPDRLLEIRRDQAKAAIANSRRRNKAESGRGQKYIY